MMIVLPRGAVVLALLGPTLPGCPLPCGDCAGGIELSVIQGVDLGAP